MRGCPSQSIRRTALRTAIICAAIAVSAGAARGEQQALQVDRAQQQDERLAYHYRIEHARYGDIGTYVNIVTHRGNDTQVDSEMHVVVKMLGITMFRQEARRTEYWRGNRLASFHGTTITNGTKIEVSGEAQGSDFAISNGKDRIVAPGNVHPSNPWSMMVLDTDAVMSTKTGEVFKAQVLGSNVQPINFDARTEHLRGFEIVDDKREFVWFDERGVPIAFRAFEDGAQIDFVLTR